MFRSSAFALVDRLCGQYHDVTGTISLCCPSSVMNRAMAPLALPFLSKPDRPLLLDVSLPNETRMVNLLL
jgi:hypothetical protein